MKFNHINDVWGYLDQLKTIDELESAFGEIPSKFGSFDITNRDTCEEDGYADICNSYWDDNSGGYDYDYHCVEIVAIDLVLEADDLLVNNTDGCIKVSNDIFDDFQPNKYINIKFIDTSDSIFRYVMKSQDEAGIVMEWFDTISL